MYHQVLFNQYTKCFTILGSAISSYPEELWYNEDEYTYPAWRIVYHALYYANIYCSSTEDKIIPWKNEIDDYQVFGKTPWPPFKEIVTTTTYSKSDMLYFLQFIEGNLEEYLSDVKPEEKCWPHWYDENQLEFHINNIRHIQHHTAEIIERANNVENFEYEWM